MYNPPIMILTTELAQRVVNRMEDGIYEAVVSYDIQVDKEELLRALQYDRAQYEAGYSDGVRGGYELRDAELVRCKDCKHRVEPTKMCAHPKAIGWDAIEPEDNDFCSCGERRSDG